MNPRIGDTVHYVSYGSPGGEYLSTCRAAVVTEIGEANVRGLAVLNPTGMFFNRGIPYDSPLTGLGADRHTTRTPGGGTWHGMDECNRDGYTLAPVWQPTAYGRCLITGSALFDELDGQLQWERADPAIHITEELLDQLDEGGREFLAAMYEVGDRCRFQPDMRHAFKIRAV